MAQLKHMATDLRASELRLEDAEAELRRRGDVEQRYASCCTALAFVPPHKWVTSTHAQQLMQRLALPYPTQVANTCSTAISAHM